jgi:thiosulfate reductase cytochrome b subunit
LIDAISQPTAAHPPDTGGPPTYPVLVRLTHFVSLLATFVLIGSGLQIFNAHPTLYAADASDPDKVILSLPAPAQDLPDGGKLEMILFNKRFGVSAQAFQEIPAPIAQGGWLEGGRRMHFTASWILIANGLFYLTMMVFGRRKRFVWPGLADLRQIGPTLRDHLRIPPVLHGPKGALNPMQKMAYFAVPVLLTPFVVATGLALSPQWDAIFPYWSDLFGGRQFARSWHFLGMLALIGFIASHVLLVAISGRYTILRMVTGKVVTPAEELHS